MIHPRIIVDALHLIDCGNDEDAAIDHAWRHATPSERFDFESFCHIWEHPRADEPDKAALFQYVMDQLIASRSGRPMRERP